MVRPRNIPRQGLSATHEGLKLVSFRKRINSWHLIQTQIRVRVTVTVTVFVGLVRASRFDETAGLGISVSVWGFRKELRLKEKERKISK